MNTCEHRVLGIAFHYDDGYRVPCQREHQFNIVDIVKGADFERNDCETLTTIDGR